MRVVIWSRSTAVEGEKVNVPPGLAARVRYGLKKAAAEEIRLEGIRLPGKGVRVPPVVVAGS